MASPVQMIEFTNQVVMALTNVYPPQVVVDPNTATNPATTAGISSISVDAFGVVTVTCSVNHGLTSASLPASILIIGVTNAVYDGAFVVLQVVSPTGLKVRNLAAIGAGSSSGGNTQTTSMSLTSSFVPAIPSWSASTVYDQNSIVQPDTSNGHYYTAIQGGASAASEPSFPTGTGQTVTDGNIIWKESGLVNSTAPPPAGAAHLAVYAGALFAWNTSPVNTSNGLDGPCSLRMSDVNNLGSWNPINQAFLDKDDGTEGMGLSAFTVTAAGIPPEGSLMSFKNYATYQIIGLFGAPDFSIQRLKTSMGCIAPRTVQYVPGFGITRLAHLGFAVVDGVDDRIVSEEIRPYLFPSNDGDLSDITVMDADNAFLSWSAQTANPAMYCTAIPIGDSGGQLTRILCYDLVLKAWTAPIDLPFSIFTMAQFISEDANPITVIGGFSDGLLSRWQSGDVLWDTGATGARSPSVVDFYVKTPTLAAKDLDQRLYVRRMVVRGINTNSTAGLSITPYFEGQEQSTFSTATLPAGTADFGSEAGLGQTVERCECGVTGSGDVELWGFSFDVVPKPAGILQPIT